MAIAKVRETYLRGATALIIEEHLPKDSFELILDGLERSLGNGNS